jgi:cell division transport system permease protein
MLAILMLIGALYYLQRELTGFVQMLDTGVLLLVFASVFALGIALSGVATVLAVNRYLRMDVDKLYYM